MCNKVVNTYLSTTRFVPQYYKTQEMSDKAVNTLFFIFHSVPGRYETQEMCGKVISEDPVILMY